MQEVVRHLSESGVRRLPQGPLPAPEAVKQLVTTRVTWIGEAPAALLRAAAVIGSRVRRRPRRRAAGSRAGNSRRRARYSGVCGADRGRPGRIGSLRVRARAGAGGAPGDDRPIAQTAPARARNCGAGAARRGGSGPVPPGARAPCTRRRARSRPESRGGARRARSRGRERGARVRGRSGLLDRALARPGRRPAPGVAASCSAHLATHSPERETLNKRAAASTRRPSCLG